MRSTALVVGMPPGIVLSDLDRRCFPPRMPRYANITLHPLEMRPFVCRLRCRRVEHVAWKTSTSMNGSFPRKHSHSRRSAMPGPSECDDGHAAHSLRFLVGMIEGMFCRTSIPCSPISIENSTKCSTTKHRQGLETLFLLLRVRARQNKWISVGARSLQHEQIPKRSGICSSGQPVAPDSKIGVIRC